MLPEKSNSEILLYQSDDGQIKIQVRLDDHTVWLTQADMVELFQSSKSNISEHIKHIFEEGELSPDSTVRRFRTVRTEGTRQEAYKIKAANELSDVEKQFIASIEAANKKLKTLKPKKSNKE